LTQVGDYGKSQLLGEHGETLSPIHQFIENKKKEWERCRARVTDCELEHFFQSHDHSCSRNLQVAIIDGFYVNAG
jgi:hypothetical protein